jgi:hypothetical protein
VKPDELPRGADEISGWGILMKDAGCHEQANNGRGGGQRLQKVQ